jgi:hypothetical protein
MAKHFIFAEDLDKEIPLSELGNLGQQFHEIYQEIEENGVKKRNQ